MLPSELPDEDFPPEEAEGLVVGKDVGSDIDGPDSPWGEPDAEGLLLGEGEDGVGLGIEGPGLGIDGGLELGVGDGIPGADGPGGPGMLGD